MKRAGVDIEGTVLPISFVAQTLFPYAKAHARAFLEKEAKLDVRPNIAALRAQAAQVWSHWRRMPSLLS
jgi:methylthioribulose 1-phosphate dehydratase / enolase-phosphatase E1